MKKLVQLSATAAFVGLALATCYQGPGVETISGSADTLGREQGKGGGIVPVPPDRVLQFRARLSGAQEVPPVDTDARGRARVVFQQPRSDIQTVSYGGYMLRAVDIVGVRAAHIHCGAVGVNGPVGITLRVRITGTTTDSMIAVGRITTPDAKNGCGWSRRPLALERSNLGWLFGTLLCFSSVCCAIGHFGC